MLTGAGAVKSLLVRPGCRYASSATAGDKYKVLVIGGGSAGLAVAQQIFNRFADAGKPLNKHDIGIVDGTEWHNYQPGWTLVGSGLKQKSELRKPLAKLIPSNIAHVAENVATFSPETNTITTEAGRTIAYEQLVVAPGLQINYDAVEGLPNALADASSGVSTIYSYHTCDKTWADIEALRTGRAIFTQPAGIVKCAGGESFLFNSPQKIMWMAWDRWRQTDRRDKIRIDFFTGQPTMFSVPKYSKALDALREERGIGGKFNHNLVSIDAANHKATFKNASDGSTVTEDYTFLHVVPPQGPLNVMKKSPIVDAAGWVEVNKQTLQHVKFPNIWALGDASSLPTSKTAAAAIAQAPVLTENLFTFVDSGKVGPATYTGYTSCPLLTGYGQLMLAEFQYNAVPDESFANIFGDQAKPRRAFYHLKKDFFPWIYFNYHVNGQWFGRHGIRPPKFA
ncbi:FAD/NAD-P-binding domain-containing protein [Vararia minispora EC-137]|uniref:FAD/NAD-P-binding domain-containing protein n=1 Tax=Vararia minispora EC-137 TaxID=1314806 RepID=A0ACB8QGE3_9AGAM|nr:FAD/NAD-P-binding domain-containing protein [Vararia minispora EC-137]